MIAFYLVLLGQVFQIYTITIVIMFTYVYKFVGIKQIISSIKELQWGKSYKALFFLSCSMFNIVICNDNQNKVNYVEECL